jgi:F420-non-reducing hydrogenase iron-sulfur subunit
VNEFEPKLVCFSCRFGWGYLAQDASIAAQVKHWIPIICSGKIDAKYVVSAFQHGADGVLILGCPEGDCHYQDGNLEARKRTYLLRKVLESFGIEPERVRIELSTDPGGTKIPEFVTQMTTALRKMGPIKAFKSELSAAASK